jgi:DNA repair exonuclease SbcCD nuclease subunit
MKFLHTADWHLGIKYTKLGPNAEKAREIRVETVKKLMDIAKKNSVDFIIAAGDLFDNNDVDRGLISIVANIIKRVEPISVYILPGNHDPLTRDSLYLDLLWDSIDNAMIFKNREPIKIPELNTTLYPCPATQKQTREDPTEWIRAADDGISIGIAHGNLQIKGFVEDPNFPINPERAERSGLDYLALGEWHSLFKHPDKNKVVRTIYPGTPETTKFGENNSGKSVIVEIENHGAEPIIQEINVGTLKWEERRREISTIDDVKHIETELTQIKEPEHRVINFYFKGVVDQEVADYLSLFETKYSERFLYFNLIKEDLYLKPNLSKLKAMIPEGAIFDKTIKAIRALMKCQPTLQEYSEIPSKEAEEILREIGEIKSAMNASPETLERALLYLYQMAKRASK